MCWILIRFDKIIDKLKELWSSSRPNAACCSGAIGKRFALLSTGVALCVIFRSARIQILIRVKDQTEIGRAGTGGNYALSDIIVSVIICTRNRARQLDEALRLWRSVKSDHSWELIILDNASTDGTKEVVEKSATDCRYLFCDRIGLGAGRDFAWREAKGKYVLFTDDDCYPLPNLIDSIVVAFEEFPSAGCIGGRILRHNPAHAFITTKESLEPETFQSNTFVPAGAIHGANFSFPKKVLEQVGGLDPSLGAGTPFPCEDVDVIARTVWAGFEARYDPRPTVRHDHGRTQADVPKLMRSYDDGRGAYYAKFIARAQTFDAYARAWVVHRSDGPLSVFIREAKSGFKYLKAQGTFLGGARFSLAALLVAARLFYRKISKVLRNASAPR